MEIADLNKDELTAQKTEVKNCGYQMVEKGLFKLVENEKLKSQQIILKNSFLLGNEGGVHSMRGRSWFFEGCKYNCKF